MTHTDVHKVASYTNLRYGLAPHSFDLVHDENFKIGVRLTFCVFATLQHAGCAVFKPASEHVGPSVAVLLDPIAGTEKVSIFPTKHYGTAPEQTATLNFQDWCLKPLGHPSGFVKSQQEGRSARRRRVFFRCRQRLGAMHRLDCFRNWPARRAPRSHEIRRWPG
jgi:hypothetical protein